MNTLRNRNRWAISLLVMSMVVAGCGREDGSDGGSATQPSAPEGPIEGTISVWAMGTEGEELDVLAQDFMAENPDVTVDVTPVPWDAAHDRIVNAIAGGEVPDVSMVGTTWMGEFAALGGLAPTPSEIDSAQFFEGAWDTTVVDGVSYGVPWYVETRLLYYRTDLAEQAGMADPPTTWDGLTELAQGMQEAGAQFGINLQPGGTGAWQTYMPFFWQAGGEIMDDDGNFTLDSAACVDSMAFYDSFFEGGLTRPTASDVPVETEFAEGAVGSFISGPWMIGIITDAGAEPDKWTVAHMPSEAAGTSFVGGSNLTVLEQSDNKATAWAFVEYLLQPDVQVKWYQTVSDLPSVEAAWDNEALSGDEQLSLFGEQLDDAKAPPAIATWEEIASVIDAQIEGVTVGDQTPEDACAAMQEQATSIGTGL